jgi:NAD-dependent SIR2 family protein deacetylase
MSDTVNHPTLGQSRPDGEDPHHCSRCEAEIPDDHVPVMLWQDEGRIMYVYCEACEGPILAQTVLQP